MVDTAASKVAAARHEGSTPSWGTMIQNMLVKHQRDTNNMDQNSTNPA